MTKRAREESPAAKPKISAPRNAPPRLVPPLAELLDFRSPYLIPMVLLLIARGLMWSWIPGGAEDAYITYRYAHHLAAGNGLVYNPGEPVFGFSSPLWTVWNALGFWLTHQPLLWSRVWSLLADLVTLLVLGGLLARSVSRPAAWCFTVFFAVWPYWSAVAMSGMESSTMVCLVALSAGLIETRSRIGGVVVGALALTRPEGVALALVLGLGLSWRQRLIAAAMLAVALVAMLSYYGTVVPQSVVAKAITYGTPGPWAGRVWWDWVLPFPLGHRTRIGDTAILTLVSVLMAPAVVLGAREVWRLRRSALALATLSALAVWAGYLLLGVAYFWWYLGVPLAGIAVIAAAGFPSMARGRALYVSALVTLVGTWIPSYRLYVGRWLEESGSFGHAADYLQAQARPGAKVMLEPIGMIGYTAPIVVVDEVGLVSPRVAARRRGGPGWYADVEAAEHPDWLVMRYGLMRTGAAFAGNGAAFRSAAERDSTLAKYQLVAQSETELRDESLVILRRIR